jgi:glycosyltransferase involved in cell wall biosynthesis
MRYTVITHIPFARRADGSVIVDRQWAEELKGLAAAMGGITVAAPEWDPAKLQPWGKGLSGLETDDWVTFVGLPLRHNRCDFLHPFRVRRALRDVVADADLIHTANLFGADTVLYFAHDYAARHGRKTVFVVNEDFYDMLEWEWVRTAAGPLRQWRRQRALEQLDAHVQRRVANASLTFLSSPAAVERYRAAAKNAVAIRQPVHERHDVIEERVLADKIAAAKRGCPLRLMTTSRMQPQKGVEMLVRAIAILESRGVAVCATLYGDGPQLPAIQELVQRLRLEHRVKLPGALAQGPALYAALAEAHVFVMPHRANDCGHAFFDAMAAGCPVIAFRSRASEGTVRDGVDGLLAANDDPESLAEAIARFHDDRGLLQRAALAARVRGMENTRTFWNELRAGWVRDLFA